MAEIPRAQQFCHRTGPVLEYLDGVVVDPPRPEIVSDQSRPLLHPAFNPPDQCLLIEESIGRGNDAGAAQFQDLAYFGKDGFRLLEVPDADAGRTVAESG